jgi:hypothetical protein
VAPKKNTGISSKGFTSLDGDMMIQWRRSFEVHESFAKKLLGDTFEFHYN